MSTQEDLKFLSSVGILSDLDLQQIKIFFEICRKKKFRANDTIMVEGQQGSTMYIFQSGIVEISQNLTMKLGRKRYEEIEKSMIKIDAKGNFFGDMAMLTNYPRTATIRTASECICFEVSRDDFISLCEKDSNLGYKVIRRIAEELCKRLENSNKNVLKLTTALSMALSK